MGKVINFFNRWGDDGMNSSNKIYNVIDVAKYVINKSIEMETPISNLKLQKILYFIQGEFLSVLKKPAFLQEIQAWKHGPVVPEVYYEFNKYIADEITSKFNDFNETILEKKDRNIIDKVIKDNLNKDAWKLVQITHKQSPWIDNYKPGENIIIPNGDIKKYFCNKHKDKERNKEI
ncbi:type II toxin-antitoxin system antitoxin SocA domain-containing protein [Clostridium sp. Marseille-Q2269]|uniref:Panacea domain-containing protein n=1 Tax=Clostridium sp. Marseille-Q2269 TaxID=2942205 RepID=UPI002072FF9A|nr:type II toxin-antitoxin system antitoxin SocA domain-containing protein [Clostridium sp. Marseille-Q2269]